MREYIERCVIESNDDHINCDFTTEELQTQIRDLKLQKAYSPDLIANELFANLPESY